MDKEIAIQVKEHGLKAVEELSKALFCCYEKCPPEEYQVVRKAVGLSIGRINLELLDFIYSLYPELDHLKE